MLNNVIAELSRYNMTQQDLAEELGVTRRTVYSWLNEETELPASALRRMALMWNCSTDYLLDFDFRQKLKQEKQLLSTV